VDENIGRKEGDESDLYNADMPASEKKLKS
jgi:hypothetical protein